MRFRPRHYLLIVIILGLGIFNLVRRHRANTATHVPVARGTSPAWDLFDNAAALRDAPDAQFQPALKALNGSIDGTNAVAIPPRASRDEVADLHGCQTWLLFYRQEHLHPSSRAGWAAQTKQHVDSCAANHRDIAS